MKTRHCCVSFLDVPEVFPFGLEKEENVLDMLEKPDLTEGKLLEFISHLEDEFEEEIYRIGQDIIGERLYRRYLFKRDGFLEIAMEKPCAVIAHFVTINRGRKFAESLAKVIKKYLGDGIGDLMVNDINIAYEAEDALTQYKLAELRKLKNV